MVVGGKNQLKQSTTSRSTETIVKRSPFELFRSIGDFWPISRLEKYLSSQNQPQPAGLRSKRDSERLGPVVSFGSAPRSTISIEHIVVLRPWNHSKTEPHNHDFQRFYRKGTELRCLRVTSPRNVSTTNIGARTYKNVVREPISPLVRRGTGWYIFSHLNTPARVLKPAHLEGARCIRLHVRWTLIYHGIFRKHSDGVGAVYFVLAWVPNVTKIKNKNKTESKIKNLTFATKNQNLKIWMLRDILHFW